MTTRETVVLIGCLVVAVILHEISHGIAALWFGDDTAKRAGRITLNPIKHVDPFGSLIIPIMAVLAGFPAFGMAKPVPVDPNRMRNPRHDMIYVSLAGPAMNFALMGVAALAAKALYPNTSDLYTNSPLLLLILFLFAYVNLLLGAFNLLPIPPLDGSALLERVLPREWLPAWYRFRPYGLLVILGLIFWTGIVGEVLSPLADHLYNFVFR